LPEKRMQKITFRVSSVKCAKNYFGGPFESLYLAIPVMTEL